MGEKNNKIIIAGGGAAGFFAAIVCAENNPDAEVIILEKSKQILGKVKISGGGRCNVTHACFKPKELIKYYPRGAKEMLGPFHQFMTGDTMEWFEKKGVALKIENDNRVFPVSNNSQSIIDCLVNSAEKAGVKILFKSGLEKFEAKENNWLVTTSDQKQLVANKLMLATGSSNQVWEQLQKLKINCVKPVPSLFTFNIKDERIEGLMGLSVQNVVVKINGSNIETSGPLLITHWGMSGPAILKLSSEAARNLAELNYNFEISINFSANHSRLELLELLQSYKVNEPKKLVCLHPQFEIPARLWKRLCQHAGISENKNWADTTNLKLKELGKAISESIFKVTGKSTYKDEFVTSGGVALEEIDFKKFESKKYPNLFFAGEILNIDGLTGGFNFQAAWTAGFIAGKAMAEKI